jgi:hypothetical protein
MCLDNFEEEGRRIMAILSMSDVEVVWLEILFAAKTKKAVERFMELVEGRNLLTREMKDRFMELARSYLRHGRPFMRVKPKRAKVRVEKTEQGETVVHAGGAYPLIYKTSYRKSRKQ